MIMNGNVICVNMISNQVIIPRKQIGCHSYTNVVVKKKLKVIRRKQQTVMIQQPPQEMCP